MWRTRGAGSRLWGVSRTRYFTYEAHSDNGKASVADVELIAGLSGDEFLVEASMTVRRSGWISPSGCPQPCHGLFERRRGTSSSSHFLGRLVLTNSGFVSGGSLRGDLSLLATTSEVSLQMEVTEQVDILVDLEFGSMILELPTPTHALLDAGTNEGFVSISDLPFDGT